MDAELFFHGFKCGYSQIHGNVVLEIFLNGDKLSCSIDGGKIRCSIFVDVFAKIAYTCIASLGDNVGYHTVAVIHVQFHISAHVRHELCHGTDVTVVLVISLEDIGVLVEEPFVVVPGFLQHLSQSRIPHVTDKIIE